MKQGPSPKRQRGRGNGRRPHYGHGHTFESNGPDVKIRGNAAQVLEKYQSLARDALASGDRIVAESYLQHAEHYYRALNANSANPSQPSSPHPNQPSAANQAQRPNNGQVDGANGGRPRGSRDAEGHRDRSQSDDNGDTKPDPESAAV
ncbi:MAG: DUF4167 domain-containing protein [Alphaproteobacteria bacterium]|jgi:hypothetical protein|nr:DUF4167 domain-containing protein [Alphaproteobacteria bacterium]MDP6518219.1 DUF4167 domain-containing protein [Alphaproteobacteria bacterium]